MPYSANPDPYTDPVTGVLRNLLGITDNSRLEDAEARLTLIRISALADTDVPGTFDLRHLQAIHQYLFGAIYPWAGRLRTVEMAKGQTRFANAEFLAQAAEEVFAGLRAERLLDGLTGEAYARRLAHYFSEVNILHPFREGNGRTQRVFFTLLVQRSGRRIAWEHMDVQENLAASIAAYNGDEGGLTAMLLRLIEE